MIFGLHGHPNGYKPHDLKTRTGPLELNLLKTRGDDPYHPLIFVKYQWSKRALLVIFMEIYFNNVLTGNVRHVLKMTDHNKTSSTWSIEFTSSERR